MKFSISGINTNPEAYQRWANNAAKKPISSEKFVHGTFGKK